MPDFPNDLQLAYETFMLLSTHYGFAVAGMAIAINPPALMVIGNVNERGHDFAKLLREFADVMDSKTDKGQIEIGKTSASDPAKVN